MQNRLFKKTIKNGKVYKFISFDGEANLIRTKIDTLKQGKIWFSFYKTLNDERILYCPYDLGEVNGGTIEMNIKERLNYKGIAKPYVDFDLNISKIILGNRCNNELIEELESYLNKGFPICRTIQ